MIQQSQFWVYIQRKWKQDVEKMFTAALFATTKIQKPPKCRSKDEKITKMWSVCHISHIHTHANTHNGTLFSHKKEGNPAIWDNTDGTWGHYAKWGKSNGERQILYGKWNFMLECKNLNSFKQRVEWCLSGDGGQGNVVYGYKLKTSR